jgi:regulator of sigma E protease
LSFEHGATAVIPTEALVTTILSFVFVLGVLIFVHELGHFLMARRIGVRVVTFSLGFGPKLLSVRRGDTEYCLSAIPLGGYVKMAGETTDDARTGAPDEFLSKTKWQRFQVLVMGPVMNLVFAVVVAAIAISQGERVPAYQNQPVIVSGLSPNSAAERAGIQPGDRIVAVNGTPVATWEQFAEIVAPRPNRDVELTVQRAGRTETIRLVPEAVGKYEVGSIGVIPIARPQLVTVPPRSPAAEGGLLPGDTIVGVGNEPSPSYERLLGLIRSHQDQPLTFEIERNGGRRTLTITPRLIDGAARVGAEISPYEVHVIHPGPLQAVALSVERNWKASRQILGMVGNLLTGEVSVKQLMGPVAIADQSRVAASMGWIPLLNLMAIISLNLGLLNLMPIPVLDGGHILILALEGLARREFSMVAKQRMFLAGFALLVLLMVTVIFNDLSRLAWVERVLPWR